MYLGKYMLHILHNKDYELSTWIIFSSADIYMYIYAGKMNLKTETTSIVSLNTSPSYQNATTSEVWWTIVSLRLLVRWARGSPA